MGFNFNAIKLCVAGTVKVNDIAGSAILVRCYVRVAAFHSFPAAFPAGLWASL